MAVIGGAGNPVGGSFTGPAEALEVVGDHGYAYSGVLDIDNTETNMLSFTTGNFYFVGTIQFNVLERHGESYIYRFYLNGAVVQGYILDPDEERQPPTTFLNVIISPYTEVRATAENMISGSFAENICNMAGRIYRTSD